MRITEAKKVALINALKIWRTELTEEIANLMAERSRIERRLAERHDYHKSVNEQLSELDAQK